MALHHNVFLRAFRGLIQLRIRPVLFPLKLLPHLGLVGDTLDFSMKKLTLLLRS